MYFTWPHWAALKVCYLSRWNIILYCIYNVFFMYAFKSMKKIQMIWWRFCNIYLIILYVFPVYIQHILVQKCCSRSQYYIFSLFHVISFVKLWTHQHNIFERVFVKTFIFIFLLFFFTFKLSLNVWSNQINNSSTKVVS